MASCKNSCYRRKSLWRRYYLKMVCNANWYVNDFCIQPMCWWRSYWWLRIRIQTRRSYSHGYLLTCKKSKSRKRVRWSSIWFHGRYLSIFQSKCWRPSTFNLRCSSFRCCIIRPNLVRFLHVWWCRIHSICYCSIYWWCIRWLHLLW